MRFLVFENNPFMMTIIATSLYHSAQSGNILPLVTYTQTFNTDENEAMAAILILKILINRAYVL